MNRARVLTGSGLLVLVGVGLTALVAARGTGDKGPESVAAKSPDMRLVCVGIVDTEDRYVGIFPRNFPQPSRVTKVLVKEGAKVKKDQPLLEFDVEILDLKVQEANDAIAAARFEESKAESAVRTHIFEVSFQEKTWKAKQKALENKQHEFKDAQWQLEHKFISKIQLDAAESALQEAELNLEAAKIKLDGLKTEVPNYLVDQAKANIKRLETLKAEAEQARKQLSCEAPDNGRIIRSFVSEGQHFHPTTRDPAFWFLKDGPLMVRADVTQEFARRVSMGKSAIIEDEADPAQQWHGRVTKIGEQFLAKRQGGSSPFDLMPVSDDRVLECQISIDAGPSDVGPKFGQKVRITLE
jgi:multidrug resistance efflux pump